MRKHSVDVTIVEATCRACGRSFTKKVNISPVEFEKSSDTMKHFVRGGRCEECRNLSNTEFVLRCRKQMRGETT
jgi:hypothetical protein